MAWLPWDIGKWESAVIVLGAFLTAAGFVWRYGRRHVPVLVTKVRFYMQLEAFHTKVIEEMKALHTSLENIGHQLAPNGRTSLRDAIDRIEVHQYHALQRARLLLTEQGFGAWESDVDGEWVWASEVLLRMASCSAADLLGSNWVNIVHVDDRRAVLVEWNSAVKYERKYRQRYRMVNQRTGESHVVDARAEPLLNPNGDVSGFLGTIRMVGVTPQRRADDVE